MQNANPRAVLVYYQTTAVRYHHALATSFFEALSYPALSILAAAASVPYSFRRLLSAARALDAQPKNTKQVTEHIAKPATLWPPSSRSLASQDKYAVQHPIPNGQTKTNTGIQRLPTRMIVASSLVMRAYTKKRKIESAADARTR